MPKEKRTKIAERAEKLLEGKLRVFYHPSFDDRKERKNILGEMPNLDKFNKDKEKVLRLQSGDKIAPEMRPCYEAPLLSKEQEVHLFRKMNYLKWRAKKLLANMNPRRVGQKRVAAIEEYLNAALEIRNQIASSNFRLATQVLRGQISFYREHTLTEALLSDAYLDVLKAVDYFDFTTGYKFSTYATWVVKKNFFRDAKTKMRDSERLGYLDDAYADTLESRGTGYEEEWEYDNRKKLVKQLLALLPDKRQRLVLATYFGVKNKAGQKATLEEISDKIGVTKERVRQLKEKGIATLREKVQSLGLTCDMEIDEDAAIAG